MVSPNSLHWRYPLTMYFSQNKLGESGGPQYWLNELESGHREHLQRMKACPVVLMTRYGEIPAHFEAVHKDFKRDKRTGKLVRANAQHIDCKRVHRRIQSGEKFADGLASQRRKPSSELISA